MNVQTFDNLLGTTRRIIAHQREIKRLRGEGFNVFSILGMEHKENETHSAFLVELLNPKGTHAKGSIFLEKFLELIGEKAIDIKSAKVKPEHHIGPKNDLTRTGGRVDIYIWDKFNNSICIENKIDAGDQFAQVERYCNHNKGKNKVYYLTLKGSEPSIDSKGQLLSGTDFYTLSYRQQILEWLDLCIKESAEQPILRESIKQYKLLIQKITATMDKKHQQDLTELMLKNYKESEYIAANFGRINSEIKERVRQSIIKKLTERLDERFTIVPGSTADKWFSQIWFKLKGYENSPLFFGLESFSGNGNYDGALFIGVHNTGKEESKYADDRPSLSKWWINTHLIPDFNGYKAHLRDSETLVKIHTDKDFKEGFINHVVEESVQYLQKEAVQLLAFLQPVN